MKYDKKLQSLFTLDSALVYFLTNFVCLPIHDFQLHLRMLTLHSIVSVFNLINNEVRDSKVPLFRQSSTTFSWMKSFTEKSMHSLAKLICLWNNDKKPRRFLNAELIEMQRVALYPLK